LRLRLAALDEDAAALLAAMAPRLAELHVRFERATPAGARAVALAFPQLTTLALLKDRLRAPIAGSLGPGGAAAFASAPLAQLERLDLRGNELGDAGALALAHAHLPALRTLDLAARYAHRSDGAAIDRGDNHIGAPGAAALVERLAPRTLRLAGNPLGDAGARALHELDRVDELRLLDLRDCGISRGEQRRLEVRRWKTQLLL
ncbi:MAG: hypothetical protein KIT31_25285, partial [Deltaproteobacteria bacterium]|nr:hypothetical protein [Deltaproteobacteria bacterium]